MLIHFAKARFWVVPKDIVTYASWRARTSASARDVARSLWSPRFRNEDHGSLATMRAKAAELGVKPGCLRYPSDGTRLQVFDFARGLVCKMQAPWAHENRIPYELEVRKNVGGLAPAVVDVAVSRDAFVEAWVPYARVERGDELLRPIIAELGQSLYETRTRSATVTIGDLRGAKTMCSGLPVGLWEVLIASLPDELPVSRVHGDLSPSNVSTTASGALQLLDWEYAREAVRTYDVWHYLYESHRNGKAMGPTTAAFTRKFSGYLGEVGYSYLCRYASALHLLHLVERLFFLYRIVEGTRVAALTNILRADIMAGMQLLSNTTTGAAV